MPDWFTCFHPREPIEGLTPGRYMFFPTIELCGLCSASRKIEKPEDRDAYWPPLSRPQHYDWEPPPEC